MPNRHAPGCKCCGDPMLVCRPCEDGTVPNCYLVEIANSPVAHVNGFYQVAGSVDGGSAIVVAFADALLAGTIAAGSFTDTHDEDGTTITIQDLPDYELQFSMGGRIPSSLRVVANVTDAARVCNIELYNFTMVAFEIVDTINVDVLTPFVVPMASDHVDGNGLARLRFIEAGMDALDFLHIDYAGIGADGPPADCHQSCEYGGDDVTGVAVRGNWRLPTGSIPDLQDDIVFTFDEQVAGVGSGRCVFGIDRNLAPDPPIDCGAFAGEEWPLADSWPGSAAAPIGSGTVARVTSGGGSGMQCYEKVNTFPDVWEQLGPCGPLDGFHASNRPDRIQADVSGIAVGTGCADAADLNGSYDLQSAIGRIGIGASEGYGLIYYAAIDPAVCGMFYLVLADTAVSFSDGQPCLSLFFAAALAGINIQTIGVFELLGTPVDGSTLMAEVLTPVDLTGGLLDWTAAAAELTALSWPQP